MAREPAGAWDEGSGCFSQGGEGGTGVGEEKGQEEGARRTEPAEGAVCAGAGSLWGGDGGLDEGVGRPEQSSRCVLKADPTVGWLWVMTEKRVNMGQ